VFKTSYKIATVWGIPIKIHISLLFILAYFGLRGGVKGGIPGILLMLLFELCIFSSIALHELGHSFVAISKGCRVREITLMLFGGAAQMESIPSKPWDEIQMAIAGPLVSIMLGGAGFYGGTALQRVGLPNLGYVVELGGIINFVLAGFNLVPAFPMDGGRILRALLTPRMGKLRATGIASQIGKGFAIIFGLVGFFGIEGLMPANPLWVCIAIFLYTVAGREYRMVRIEENMKKMGGIGGFGGFDLGSMFTTDTTHTQTQYDESNDRVTISPPPYEKGPDSTTEIREEKKSPFGGIFR